MSAHGFRRLSPQLSRAKQLEYWKSRISDREAADPLHPIKTLFRTADPTNVKLYGVGIGDCLSRLASAKRRAHVVRAWCAMQCGWRDIARDELAAARHWRRAGR